MHQGLELLIIGLEMDLQVGAVRIHRRILHSHLL